MKKILFALTLMASVGIVSCSSDDDSGSDDDMNGQNCVICAATEIQGQMIPESEVCEGENGNAFSNGIDLTIPFDEFIDLQETFTTCN